MWKAISLLTMLAATITIATPASAAPPVCGDREKVLSNLSAKYAEEPVAVGVTANGGVIEVLKAPDGATWTILFTHPLGPSCLIASGEAWLELTRKISGPGV
ncbi:MAG: hypothetical protein ABID63_10740 [Pseudomonadota bacterium]